jgi:uncharacterized membrane protein
MALSNQEQEFMIWWERVRDRERKTFRQLIVGLPLGLIFATPILLSFFSSRFWYKRADMVGNSQFNPAVLVVAVLAIAVFVGIFNKKMKWERYEEQYQRLKAKSDDANPSQESQ